MKTAENLLRTLTRALLANPNLEPEITITEGAGRYLAEIDVRPFDPAPMIGSSGTMKFAVQAILAGSNHPSTWEIHFRQSGKTRSPMLRNQKPDPDVMKSVVEAAVTHWRRQPGTHAAASMIETSKTTVVAILVLDEMLGQAQRGAWSRVARAIGKANGYRGTCIIEKPTVPA